jgi:hypothetical protein
VTDADEVQRALIWTATLAFWTVSFGRSHLNTVGVQRPNGIEWIRSAHGKQQSDDDPSGNDEQHDGKQEFFARGNCTMSVRSAEWMIVATSLQSLVSVALSSGPRLQVMEWCNRLHEEFAANAKSLSCEIGLFH